MGDTSQSNTLVIIFFRVFHERIFVIKVIFAEFTDDGPGIFIVYTRSVITAVDTFQACWISL